MENLISLSISESDKAEINKAINTLSEKLLPHLHALTDAERQSLYKLGDNRLGFVRKCLTYSKNSFADQTQVFVDNAEFEKDVEATALLLEFFNRINPIVRAIEDTKMLAGNEAMTQSNMVYSVVKMSAKNGVPGAQDAFNDLKNEYAISPKKANPNPPKQ